MRARQLFKKGTPALLAGSLVFGNAAPALTALAATSTELEAQADAVASERASLEAQVAEAQARLEELYAEAEMCEYDLVNTTNLLDQTIARIGELDVQVADTTQRLGSTQDDLAAIIADDYKHGAPSLLDMVLSATSFEDLLARITYANQVMAHEDDVIQEVRALQVQLEGQKAELEVERANEEQLVVEQQQRLDAVNAATAEVEAYQSQLSAEVAQKIAEEEETRRLAAEEAAREQAEAARIAAEQAAAAEAERQRQLAAQQQQSAGSSPVASGSSSSASASSSGGSNASSGSSGTVATTSYVPTVTGDVSTFVARAYSIIGSGYSYSGYYWTGSTAGSWFTCSGVVDFALGRPSRSSSPEILYAQVGARLKHSVDQLNYGDLVFFTYAGRYPGHVGIYIGGGSMIDASPGTGVSIRGISSAFIGGGPIF